VSSYASRGGDGGDGIVIVRYSEAIGAPTNVTATAGLEQVSLSWTAPSYTAGQTITRYAIQHSSASDFSSATTTQTTSSATTFTITGLTPGTYWFRVAAVASGGGTGNYSSGVSSVPFGAVTQFAVTMTGGTTALLAATKTAGTSFSVRVTAQDANGTTNTNYTGAVTLSSTAFSGTVSATISSGGFVDNVSITPTIAGASRTISASAGAVTTADASGSFTVDAGAASKLLVAPVGTPIAGVPF
jgi:predicted phage tail protein